MNSAFWTTGIRIVAIILLQGLIFRRIQLGGDQFNYISIIFYPVILMLLPMKTNRALLLVLGFFIGLMIDMFYDSAGLHASACVFIAFMRPVVLKFLEPRGGYPVNANPTLRDFGSAWFLRYSAIMLGLFLLFYFSVEVFTFVYIGEILLKVVVSFALSFMAILMYIFLFNPKE